LWIICWGAGSIGRVDDIASALGQTIRRHRLAAQLTHEMLAERASLHPNHISVLERGKRLPTVAVLIRLGDALGVPGWVLLKEAQEADD
jgi:transcriptional regulator with XRE-family HTH domain